MGKVTAIAWADATFNPWIGCTRVSPGCDHCYAEALDRRHRWGGAEHWGPGVPRHRTSAHYWRQPLVWDRVAHDHGGTKRVFPSLCDPFDNEVDPEWRSDFFSLVSETPHLTWLLLTKRIGNVASMLPVWWHDPEAWSPIRPGGNVWLGASIVNQAEADRDVPKLIGVEGFAKRFLSYEPALGPVSFEGCWVEYVDPRIHENWLERIDWVIVGGESTQGGQMARPFEIEWARSIIAQCKVLGVACFVKQIGSNPVLHGFSGYPRLRHRGGADPSDWPVDVRVQQVPA